MDRVQPGEGECCREPDAQVAQEWVVGYTFNKPCNRAGESVQKALQLRPPEPPPNPTFETNLSNVEQISTATTHLNLDQISTSNHSISTWGTRAGESVQEALQLRPPESARSVGRAGFSLSSSLSFSLLLSLSLSLSLSVSLPVYFSLSLLSQERERVFKKRSNFDLRNLLGASGEQVSKRESERERDKERRQR